MLWRCTELTEGGGGGPGRVMILVGWTAARPEPLLAVLETAAAAAAVS